MMEEHLDHKEVEVVGSTQTKGDEELGLKRDAALDDDAMKLEGTLLPQVQSEKNLYEEAHDMLLNAFLMFCLPDLRELAREGLLRGDPEQIQRIIDLPATLEDIIDVFVENKELLTEERLKDAERAQMYQDTLQMKKKFGIDLLDDETKLRISQNIFLIHFEDSNAEDECVYAIILNTIFKRVGVYFRGSVTNKDFRQDAKFVVSSIPNPVKGDHLAEELGVHLGFREYLYNEEELPKAILPFDGMLNTRGRKASESQKAVLTVIPEPTTSSEELANENPMLKFQVILEHTRVLLKDRPGYSLWIAGHSLGAALSVLVAMEAAATDDIPKPVTCITSGGPKVGNLDFLLAFQHLERQKRLRCLQIANDRDPVTLSPPTGALDPFFITCCQVRKFRHVGLRVKLRDKGYVVMYPMKMRTWTGVFLCDCMNLSRAWAFIIVIGASSFFGLVAVPYIALPMAVCCAYSAMKVSREHHTQLKYIQRLEFNKNSLEKLDIDALNERRFALSRWRVPVLHVEGRRCWCHKRRF